MPNSVYATSLPRKAKEYPTLQEAAALLLEMPSKTPMDLRRRAIFGIAFLAALRADTLVSLRICNVDVINRLIVQDATTVRAKNGKSLSIYWFPVPAIFSDVVVAWIAFLEQAGFGGQDALFPSDALLKSRRILGNPNRGPIEPMSTIHAATDAFAIACRNSSVKYTPHSAKHTIGAERDSRPLTHQQRKEWSRNMGHENEQTTERHYGKISEERRAEIFEELRENKTSGRGSLTDEQKIALYDGIIEDFVGR